MASLRRADSFILELSQKELNILHSLLDQIEDDAGGVLSGIQSELYDEVSYDSGVTLSGSSAKGFKVT